MSLLLSLFRLTRFFSSSTPYSSCSCTFWQIPRSLFHSDVQSNTLLFVLYFTQMYSQTLCCFGFGGKSHHVTLAVQAVLELIFLPQPPECHWLIEKIILLLVYVWRGEEREECVCLHAVSRLLVKVRGHPGSNSGGWLEWQVSYWLSPSLAQRLHSPYCIILIWMFISGDSSNPTYSKLSHSLTWTFMLCNYSSILISFCLCWSDFFKCAFCL